MRNIIFNEILIPSLKMLYQHDYDNIKFGVSERNICARLAHHMENIMREYDRRNNSDIFQKYFVDVEYNRMGNGDIKRYENNAHNPQTMVSDLLIQSRGPERNYLAVEMKKKDNEEKRYEDRRRLKSLVKPDGREDCVHNTFLGAFIIYSSDDVEIELYYSYNNRIVKKTRRLVVCSSPVVKTYITEENNSLAQIDI